jgi:RNA polymerase sigma-70 factor (ECF subfamily)
VSPASGRPRARGASPPRATGGSSYEESVGSGLAVKRVDASKKSVAFSDEREIAAGLAESVDRNFERFVTAYQHRLFGFVLTLVGNAGEAEEIAQEAFVSAYRALTGYDAARRRALALRPWLFTIALNNVRNRSRRAPALPLDDAIRDGRIAPAPAETQPEALAESHARVAAVRRALEELSPRYRLPVILRHLQGFSYDEIGTLLDQPAGTARSNVHRGLALLRASNALKGAL